MRASMRTLSFPLAASTLALALSLLGGAGCSDDTTDPEVINPDLPATLGGPARGISITTIEANQGSGIVLAEGEDYVEPDQRNAFLVRDRDTLIRFQHVLTDPDAWIPRELTGILHIVPADGSPELTRVRTFLVEADSDPGRLGENFYFSLLAEEAQPGASFWLELRETDSAIDVSSLDEGVTVAPEQAQLLGFEPTTLELEVVLVPVDYRYVDPPRYPDIQQDDIILFRDELLQQNPVQEVKISVREEPLIWDEQLINLGELLSPTRALKETDDAPPHVYYHALVDVGGPSVNMVAGIAWLTDDSMEDGPRRTAATVYYKRIVAADEESGDPERVFPPTGSARTWVHEVGHNQGLPHIYCPGADSAGPDPDYPHENGKIGVHGFGIRNFHMYTPQHSHDYMSYCGNSWVSDWTWNKTYARIETLTTWAGASVIPAPTVPTLVGTLHPDGSEQWWMFDAPAPDPETLSATQTLEFSRQGQLLARAYGQVELLSDGQTMVVSVALPAELASQRGRADGSGFDAITRVEYGGERHPLALAGVRDVVDIER